MCLVKWVVSCKVGYEMAGSFFVFLEKKTKVDSSFVLLRVFSRKIKKFGTFVFVFVADW